MEVVALNIFAIPAGGISLWILWRSDGSWAFWLATLCFFAYCLGSNRIEKGGPVAASEAAVRFQAITLCATVLLGAYGFFVL
jgi:hypothetical protein